MKKEINYKQNLYKIDKSLNIIEAYYLKVDVFESFVDAIRELGDSGRVSGHSVDSHDLETSRFDDTRAHLDNQRYVFGERGLRTEFERYFKGGSFRRHVCRG